jgi:ferritin-like metal-binding protein YciE
MAATKTRDAKLIQYLNEAYGKEKELEQALEAHISMTTQATYKKRLKQHLRETKGHAREVERRLRKLDGGASGIPKAVGKAVGRGTALAKSPLHAVRGTSDEEKQLKNAKAEYSNEHEEIATYTAIETLADEVGDDDTAKVARAIRREEERMARYLEGLIPRLTKAVVRAEIPSDERRTRRSTRGRSGSASTSRANGGRRRSTSSSRPRTRSQTRAGSR